jgi:hypothetical protein
MRDFLYAHGSPPCQGDSATRELAKAQAKAKGRPVPTGRAVKLLEPTRRLMARLDIPWTIENVHRSPVRHWPGAVRLCGSSWGLKVERHRWFAPSPGLPLEGSVCDHAAAFDVDPVTGKPRPWGVYGSTADAIPSGGRTVRSIDHGHEAMGVSHRRLPWTYLCEGLPVPYGRWIGSQVLRHLGLEVAA